MKYLKLFENFDLETPEKEIKKIENCPQSVKLIYKRFNKDARKSIDDNIERFSKVAKKVFYDDKKEWKEYFKKDEFKNLKTLNDVVDSLEKWLK